VRIGQADHETFYRRHWWSYLRTVRACRKGLARSDYLCTTNAEPVHQFSGKSVEPILRYGHQHQQLRFVIARTFGEGLAHPDYLHTTSAEPVHQFSRKSVQSILRYGYQRQQPNFFNCENLQRRARSPTLFAHN
jgi:hypothetical protein